MRNARLNEAQSGIKIGGRNINNLRYTDDTTLMAESKEELKNLLMKEKSEKLRLKLNIQKSNIMASGPMTSWQIDGETMETVTDFIFLGSKITADGDFNDDIKRHLLLGRKAMTNLSLSLVSKSCLTLATPWTAACQAPLSIGFSKQEYWSGLPFPSPQDLPDPGIEPGSPAFQSDSLLTEL